MLKLRERNPNQPKIMTTVTWNLVSLLLTITLCLQSRPRVHVEGDLRFDVSVTCAVVGVVLCFCYALYVNMIVVMWSSLPDLICAIKKVVKPGRQRCSSATLPLGIHPNCSIVMTHHVAITGTTPPPLSPPLWACCLHTRVLSCAIILIFIWTYFYV